MPMQHVRMKVSLKNDGVDPTIKVNAKLPKVNYTSGQDVRIDEDEAADLVTGGFADYLDSRGYVIEHLKSGKSVVPEAEPDPVVAAPVAPHTSAAAAHAPKKR